MKKVKRYGFLVLLALGIAAALAAGAVVVRRHLRAQLYEERAAQLTQVTIQLRTTLRNALDAQWETLDAAEKVFSEGGCTVKSQGQIFMAVRRINRLMNADSRNSFLFLLDDTGNCYDSSGKRGIWGDINQITDNGKRHTFISDSATYDEVCWAFVSKLDAPVQLTDKGGTITHLVWMKEISSIDEYYDSQTYDGKNETYILKENGTRMYDNTGEGDSISSYNVFKALRSMKHLREKNFDAAYEVLKNAGTVSTNVSLDGKEYYYGLADLEEYGTILMFLIPAQYVAPSTIAMVGSVLRVFFIFALVVLLLGVLFAAAIVRLQSWLVRYEQEQKNFRQQEELNLRLQQSNEALKSSMEASQEAFRIAQAANSAKSEFLSNMSHDIRTPMNAVMGLSTMLGKEAENPERVRDYARKILASSQHLLGLINDVLDMSKIESGRTTLNLTEFNIADMVEELGVIVRPQAKGMKQSFEITVKDISSEYVIGDKLRLNQILLNLLSNAVKYTQPGGAIHLRISQLPQTGKNFARFRFVVSDNGPGMSEEFQERIFEPFTREQNSNTNRIQGTGLGMAITKNLIELMGGSITMDSRPGEGSAFTVELELRLQQTEIDQEFWKKHGITHMLVVDDEMEICTGIVSTMSGTGVSMQVATDGRTAVAMTQCAVKDGRSFDLILLDWKMPDMDGLETARRIRRIVPKNIPIMILTAYDWKEIEEEAYESGISGFLPKPFFVTNFMQTVEQITEEPQLQEEAEAAGAFAGKHFLAAEDNRLNCEVLRELLRMKGATVDFAQDGREAVSMFEQAKPGQYAAVFMDVQMPVMNGYEAAKAIRACAHPEAKSIVIVAMTADAFAEDVRRALRSGMNAHTVKPVDMDVLEKILLEQWKKA